MEGGFSSTGAPPDGALLPGVAGAGGGVPALGL
jgi:hypothetical protein